MNYFQKLIDTHDSASSKIFLGLVFAALTTIIVITKVFMESIPMDLLYFTGGLTLSFLGLSSIDRFTHKQDDSDTSKSNEIG